MNLTIKDIENMSKESFIKLYLLNSLIGNPDACIDPKTVIEMAKLAWKEIKNEN